MTKTFTLLLVCLACTFAKAQTAPSTQPFGKVDIADLELKSCEFEPDANAEVLFDKGLVYYDHNFSLAMERHKRIKIFNDKGKDNANIRIEYFSGSHVENITGLQAQTISLVDGKPEIVKLDKKLIYVERVDKLRSAYVFSLPNVKAGSIIEYKYVWNTTSISNFPDWDFQDKIPVRYSELITQVPDILYFKVKNTLMEPLVVSKRTEESRNLADGTNGGTGYQLVKTVRGVANIHSLPDEPYMTSTKDNYQSIVHYLTGIAPIGQGFAKNFSDSWAKVGGILADDDDFGGQLKRKLAGEEAIIAKAKGLNNDLDRIEYLFNEVKNTVKWSGADSYQTDDGTVAAWQKKSGNSAEVNLILYHLLKQSGVQAFPMIVSTRQHGKVASYYPFLYQFNRAVVYVTLKDDREFILDATSKYNVYNETPDDLLNGYALYIDKERKIYDMVYLSNSTPAKQVVVISADIKKEGKMDGVAQVSSFSYNRAHRLKMYKTDGEKKYTEYITGNNNNLKVASLNIENMDIDTLPLVQKINFNQELTGSDDSYIYFNPNLFTNLKSNPFLSETRLTDIDFGHRNNYSLIGLFKMPPNYKADAIPKNITMIMPDSSIIFRRMVANDEEKISVRYFIDYKKTTYRKDNYAEFYEFCKRMYEMLNEQIVLKKS
ncbi:DUF3857 domain-containing protein [Mucilaginibacter pallidiroseus]|uniref:DUF3857 domain-containing protein n=1 Tax=Mucilaginibacter pallidiroseus TaxID=2599295 RepID=A0A563UE87_9SPHI|nr:DUF3857 domain-containing protein [Mucilaginibacter pallidiroseus]TWR29671.1 DUF3857 domain-containing protein [Mucilaginibacter pallidiroseus]